MAQALNANISTKLKACYLPAAGNKAPFVNHTSANGLFSFLNTLGIAPEIPPIPHDPRVRSTLEKNTNPQCLIDTHEIYQALKKQTFDHIFFHLSGGLGYYCLVAKSLGIAFSDTRLHVIIDETTLQRDISSRELPQLGHTFIYFMEKRCAELADTLISPDPLSLKWLKDQEWALSLDLVELPAESNKLKNHISMIHRKDRPRDSAIHHAQNQPLVSICMVHHNRQPELLAAIKSLENQTYPVLEIILVDNGSNFPGVGEFLNSLSSKFYKYPLQIIRSTRKSLGACRNLAARHARGSYLLFMDDDNIARSHEVETFIRCALHSAADVLTCIMDRFITTPGNTVQRWLPLGGDIQSGIFENIFGDANALVQKSSFFKVGGFSEEDGMTYDDWDFFAKAVLSDLRLEIVPEVLFDYRFSHDGMNMKRKTVSRGRMKQPYFDLMPKPYRLFPALMQRLYADLKEPSAPES